MRSSPHPDSAVRAMVFRWFNIGILCFLAAFAAYTLAAVGYFGWPETVRTLCGYAGFAVAYLTIGLPAYRAGNRLLVDLFLGVTIVIILATSLGDHLGGVLLQVLGIVCGWVLSGWSRRRGVVYTAVLFLAAILVIWFRDPPTWGQVVLQLTWLTALFGLSVAVGSAVIVMVRFAERYVLLSEELRAAQQRVAEQERAAGVALERERVAREVHDTLAQGFSVCQLMSRRAQDALHRGDLPAVGELLGHLEVSTTDNLSEARALVRGLTPAPLQGATLSEALRQLVERWEQEMGVAVTLRIDEGLTLTPAEDVVVLRAAQESLTNVRRHAAATRVRVELRECAPAGQVALSVADDGTGMSADIPAGYGIAGMHTRVQMVGGTVAHTAGLDGRGTTVTVTLPKGRA
ncbi:MAG: sensor histidine kinase [Promicromonosporaceae bacterium]|nr:sensor histidine kinase [Promicromonosporaceae bacterium]